MSNFDLNNHTNPNISAVIFDLDGTLLNTESVSKGVLRELLASYGKVLITDNEHGRVGRTPKDSAIAFVQNYELPLTPDEFIALIQPLYMAKWKEAEALPGANRLIQHLHKHQVLCALASNSLRESIDGKISYQKEWKECFSVIIGSDQVPLGKPSPDLFLEAAKRLDVESSNCLVIEDSLIGVQAAKAAGMKVVVVPSQFEADAATVADSDLHSLLEFRPELWGLPPFDDWVDNALPIDPIYLEGLIIDGFLADFPEKDNRLNNLPVQSCGVYFGWAKVGIVSDLKVVVSIAKELSSEIQTNINVRVINGDIDHLSGEQIHLVLVGYIRGFRRKGNPLFNSEIHENDTFIANSSLQHPMFRCPDSRI